LHRTELVADPSAPREARASSRETCRRWSLPPAIASAVVDLASELVSNAARHGHGPVVLALELGTGQVSVSVFDDGPGHPELLPYRPGLSERGLGLHLVQRLSDRWGWTGDGHGKWVWARVSLPSDPSAEQVLPGRR
ncbi:MAG: serine/threonine protein kinase, partial [Frankiales bacterium]|nr:serine/threonine protein kinase [Frankiales bacterium]